MDAPAVSSTGGDGSLTEQHETHQLPALPPDAEDQGDDITHTTESHTAQMRSVATSESDIATDSLSLETTERTPSEIRETGEQDGKLDPAWGITRTDSARILDGIQRTASFPAPPLETQPISEISDDTLGTAAAEPLQNSQQWLDQEHNDELLTDEVEADASPVVDLVQEDPPESHLQDPVAERFEEGVPLLGSKEQEVVEESPVQADASDSLFGAMDATDETAFFSSLGQPLSQSEQPGQIDRKSTSDVLDSLSFAARHEESTRDVSQPSIEKSTEPLLERASQDSQSAPEDKWAAFMGDDDEFLVEDADDLLPDSEPGSPSSFIASLQNDNINVPELNLDAQPTAARVEASVPFSNQSVSVGSVGLTQTGLPPSRFFPSQPQQPPAPIRAESFADQAKGGYKSPYDLPIDISKPKRKASSQRAISQPQKGGMPPPPPRTSSMSSEKYLPSQSPPSTSQNSSTIPEQHASSVQMNNGPARSSTSTARNTSSSSFFEELPVTARSRPSGRYTTSQSVAAAPQVAFLSPPKQRPSPEQPQPSPAPVSDPYAQFQLQPPERVDPYANIALQTTPAVPAAAASTRYSPAPPSALAPPKPTPSPRYSPAPPAQVSAGQGRYALQPVGAPPLASHPTLNRYVSQSGSIPGRTSSPAMPFQPRTSSPLAHQHRTTGVQTGVTAPISATRTAASPADLNLNSPPRSGPLSRPFAPSDQAIYPTSGVLDPNGPASFAPPQRPRTQSPSRRTVADASLSNPGEHGYRPASAFDGLPTAKIDVPVAHLPVPAAIPRSQTDNIDFIVPTDETGNDPLERWKGAPIFSFGFGGSVVTSFPLRTPRYASGLTRPQLKAGVGEVKVQKADMVWPMSEHNISFPGPLRAKAKKKDVVSWLSKSITRFEAESPAFLGVAQALPDPRKRHEEKVLLWKTVKVLVENDGHLETPDAIKAINVILAPEIHAIDESTASQYNPEADLVGIYAPGGAPARPDSVDALAVETLRKHLLKGNRKDAVWHAVECRLWAHAFLLASTLGSEPELWRQVVQEFVRQEVKTIGQNAESLSAFYEILGGNLEESIDQLVPPSARAGLQMVSRVDGAGPIRNALDGLDKWKETLTLVLNNRSNKDYRALVTLARLLNDYGRVEASHICLLFARNPEFPAVFGGLDDSQASVVLLGADQRNRAGDIHLDEDAVLLTEIYEFATSTLAGTNSAAPMPYLAPYKLQRAKSLADHGYKAEAQAYCDALTTGFKSGSKTSPYYHSLLLGELDELSNRIKQIPVQSTSWMSKPSIEKVSGSLFSKFTNFVAGDDSDAASQGSGKDAAADIGPFANVTASPTLSRSGSQSDLYGGYPAVTPAIAHNSAGSRYAPNGMMSARSSSELGRGRPSLDNQRSPPSTSYGLENKQSIYSPLTVQSQSPARASRAYQPLGTSPSQNFSTSPAFSNYQPTPPQSAYMPSIDQGQQSYGLHQNNAYAATPHLDETSPYTPSETRPFVDHQPQQSPNYGGFMPVQAGDVDQSNQTIVEASQSYGYEPPSDTGYVPYAPEPDSDGEANAKKSKKKSIMDDDDDYSRMAQQSATSSRVASLSLNDGDAASRRKANDDAADAAFRAAAEADAQRAAKEKEAKRASGWFGGWLGGAKKAPDSLDSKPASGGDQKVYKAKLGENKMKLYYDKDLKKWVNPDDPDSAKAKGATPPPPRMGGTPGPPPLAGAAPPRSVSGGGASMPPPLSRSGTPASISHPPGTSDSNNSFSANLPPSVNTSLGLASGSSPSPSPSNVPLPPTGGNTPVPPANTAATPLVSRPQSHTVNNIDDLLGPPTGGTRRAGGARGAKKAKGGRYIDVMAK